LIGSAGFDGRSGNGHNAHQTAGPDDLSRDVPQRTLNKKNQAGSR
jgi:hypothetical protein